MSDNLCINSAQKCVATWVNDCSWCLDSALRDLLLERQANNQPTVAQIGRY
jgi:hypothetical protein